MQLICVFDAANARHVVMAHHDDSFDVSPEHYPANYVVIPYDGLIEALPKVPEAPAPSAAAMETPDGLARHAAQYRYAEHPIAPTPTTSAQLKAYAASRRYYRSIAGVTVAGTLYATDDAAERRIALKWSVFQANAKATIAWKAPGGFVTLDLAGFTAMAQGVAAYREACFAAEAQAETGIKDGSVTTMAQIDALMASAGA